MDRQFVMTEKALTLAVLESTLRFLESGQGVLTESRARIDEGRLQDAQKGVRAAIEAMKASPEEFGMKMNRFLKSGYEKTLNTVKDVLARHGITATRNNQITGMPDIESTSEYDDRVDRENSLKSIRELVKNRTHQFDDALSGKQKHYKLFVPSKLDGRWGYSCSVVGTLADDIERLDGDGLTVTLTDTHRYGFDDDPFYEKTYFITPSQAQTA